MRGLDQNLKRNKISSKIFFGENPQLCSWAFESAARLHLRLQRIKNSKKMRCIDVGKRNGVII